MEELELSPGPVRVTNMPGAGGGVAFANAVTQRSDHSNVLFSASPATTLRLAQGQYGHLTVDDVRWIGAIAAEYGIIAVSHVAPWETLTDLMADWVRDPASVVVAGGSAAAGQDHMKVMLLARAAGIEPGKVRYVPFDGGGEALTALLGGFVSVFPGEGSEVEAQVEAGNIRVLAVLAPERIEGPLADSPTAREQGFDVVWVTWRGFYVPGDITETEYDAWLRVMRALQVSPEWQEARRLNRLRSFSLVGTEFENFVRAQVRDFGLLSRDIGLIK
jgi:putative tricarboxylic transport membrane protein